MNRCRVVMLLSNAFRPDPRVLKEARSLANVGYEVTVIAWDREGTFAAQEKTANFVVQRVQDVRSGYGVGLAQTLRLPRFWLAAWRRMNKLRPDVVHCHDFDTLPPGWLWAKLHHRPVIYDAHEYYTELQRPRLRGLAGKALLPLIAAAEQALSRSAAAVVTVDERMASRYHNRRVVIIGHYPPADFAQGMDRSDSLGGFAQASPSDGERCTRVEESSPPPSLPLGGGGAGGSFDGPVVSPKASPSLPLGGGGAGGFADGPVVSPKASPSLPLGGGGAGGSFDGPVVSPKASPSLPLEGGGAGGFADGPVLSPKASPSLPLGGGGAGGMLVYAGRFSSDRGMIVIAQALQHLAAQGMRPMLRLLGTWTNPAEEQAFWQAMSGLENQVEMVGWVQFAHVPTQLVSADVALAVLQPIERYRVALPVKLFEYMACGLPVIISDFPPNRAVVAGADCGLLVDPTNADAVAAAIAHLIAEPAEARRLGQNGRRAFAERYNWQALEPELRALYAELNQQVDK